MKDQRRRRWSLGENAAPVRRTYEPSMSVSLAACQEGVSAGLLFQWRTLERQGAFFSRFLRTAVRASKLVTARAETAKLQRVLSKKTLKNEILKETVEYAPEKIGLRARLCCPGTSNEKGLPDDWAGALASARAAWTSVMPARRWPNCRRPSSTSTRCTRTRR